MKEGPRYSDTALTAEDWRRWTRAKAAGLENLAPIRYLTIEEIRKLFPDRGEEKPTK